MIPTATIEGVPLWRNSDGSYSCLTPVRVDGDGAGPSHGDPDYQNATSLQYQGQSLNADLHRYFVLPEALVAALPGVVLGCKGFISNVRNGRSILAVCGDEGPNEKLGEYSIASVAALGLNASPTEGGTEDHIFALTFWPGVPAEVDGRIYALQPYQSQ